MDKASVKFAVESFTLMLAIVPNMASMKKIANDVGSKIPASLKEELNVTKFPETIKAFVESKSANVLDDARDHFKKWAENAAKVIEGTPEDQFERRGRDVSNVRVTLFGNEDSVPNHAIELLKGSKLYDIMQSGPGKNFGAWGDLHVVLNAVKSGISQVIPEDKRPKRKAKGSTPETADATE